jgi:hypothetical protein
MIILDPPFVQDFESLQKALWSPILLRPIMGSPEQYVIGVAVVSEQGVHLERANQLRRLDCIFSDSSGMLITVAETALNIIEDDLLKRGKTSLIEFKPAISGIERGELRDSQGQSLKQIAVSWMSAISSLYKENIEFEFARLVDDSADDKSEIKDGGDRLPSLVLEYVRNKRPSLDKFFNAEIINGQKRRTNPHGVIIDFAGSKLVANFGTLANSNYASSIGHIKTRLWELKVDRCRKSSLLSSQQHEMIIQHTPIDDPQLSKKQIVRLQEAIESLKGQAAQQDVIFKSMISGDQIGEHILSREAA